MIKYHFKGDLMCKKCGCEKSVYVFSDKKIKRYMSVCARCGNHIKWISNETWEEIKNDVTIISESKRQELRNYE